MISYKPSRTGYAHVIVPLVLILCGLSAVFGSTWQNAYAPALLQLLGFAALSGAIFFINRYSITTFVYTVDEETPGLLCVYRITGKKKTVAASVDLKSAVGARLITPDSAKKAPGTRRLNCCLNLFPAKRAVITYGPKKSPVELVIETDDAFFEEIEKRI